MTTNALRTGYVFALTVALGYTACTLFFWLFPAAALGFMNGLFHGLDFTRLQAGASLFSFGGFAGALAVISVWAFVLGVVFAWLNQRLGAS